MAEKLTYLKLIEKIEDNETLMATLSTEEKQKLTELKNSVSSKPKKKDNPLTDVVLEDIKVNGGGSVSEIIARAGLVDLEGKPLSTQKLTPVLTSLVKEDKIEKVKEGKKTVYTIKAEEITISVDLEETEE